MSALRAATNASRSWAWVGNVTHSEDAAAGEAACEVRLADINSAAIVKATERVGAVMEIPLGVITMAAVSQLSLIVYME